MSLSPGSRRNRKGPEWAQARGTEIKPLRNDPRYAGIGAREGRMKQDAAMARGAQCTGLVRPGGAKERDRTVSALEDAKQGLLPQKRGQKSTDTVTCVKAI